MLWVQEQVARRKLVLQKVLGTLNPADIMAKYNSLDSAARVLETQNLVTFRVKADMTVEEGCRLYEPPVMSYIDRTVATFGSSVVVAKKHTRNTSSFTW